MSHFRFCRLSERWVIIAENRLRKPDMIITTPEVSENELTHCPFEYGNESLSGNEIYAIREKESSKNSMDWKTRVVPNLYHALSVEETKETHCVGFFERQNGLGVHEVIIETPDHNRTMEQYTTVEFENYIKTIMNRMADLEKDTRLEYIQVFKNCGKYAGASLPHPHSQIIATPFIPKNIKEKLEIQKSYFEKHGRSLIGDMVDEEIRLDERIIYENGTFIAFCPYASSFPFEVLITSKLPICKITELTTHQISDLAVTMEFLFKRLYRELGDFPFNILYFNMPPASKQNDPDFFYRMGDYFRFMITITPRIYQLAGFELSSGIYINPIPPELATIRLREEK
ncbi:MAG: galactose-1-phosphate uridylyltransferase [Sulfuricurvum sp.]